jgi:hypothetical protein
MQLVETTTWHCNGCGDDVAVPGGRIPTVTVFLRDHRKQQCVVTMDGATVHRCPVSG